MFTNLSDYENYVKNKKVLITIFLVTYNRANFLELTIQSVLKQTYKDFCLVILDNASTDNTEDIVNKFDDNRIIYIKHKVNIGAPANGNFAFNIALTSYFIIFHDDDLMLPHFLEKELECIQRYNYDILSSFAKHIDENGKIIEYYRNTDSIPITYSGTEYFKSFINVSPNTIYCPSVIYKTDFIKKNKLLSDFEKAGPACDVYLFLEIERLGGKIGILPLELFLYRLHSKQDSNINKFYIQIKLIKCLLNNPYYSNLLYNNKKEFFKFIIAIIAELMISYNLKPDKQKLSNVLKELLIINSSFLKNKKLSLILKICNDLPSLTSKMIVYIKSIYRFYKKLKYSKY